jgi:hypothetical protein
MTVSEKGTGGVDGGSTRRYCKSFCRRNVTTIIAYSKPKDNSSNLNDYNDLQLTDSIRVFPIAYCAALRVEW